MFFTVKIQIIWYFLVLYGIVLFFFSSPTFIPEYAILELILSGTRICQFVDLDLDLLLPSLVSVLVVGQSAIVVDRLKEVNFPLVGIAPC